MAGGEGQSRTIALQGPPPPRSERRLSEHHGGPPSPGIRARATRIDRPARVADEARSVRPAVEREEQSPDAVRAFRQHRDGISPGAQKRSDVDNRCGVSRRVASSGGANPVDPQGVPAVDEDVRDRPPGWRRKGNRGPGCEPRGPALGAPGEPDPLRAGKPGAALPGISKNREKAVREEGEGNDRSEKEQDPPRGEGAGGAAARGAVLTQGAAKNTLFFPT